MFRSSSSSSSLPFQMPSTKAVYSAAATAAAAAMIVRSAIKVYMPPELRSYLYSKLQQLLGSLSSQFTIVIEDFDGMNPNELFRAAELYLEPTVSTGTRRYRVSLPKKETKISLVMERNSELVDSFNGVKLKWRLVTKSIKPRHIGGWDPYNPIYVSELRRHELSFDKKHKEMVLTTYLPFVMERSRELTEEKKTLKLFTLRADGRHVGRGNPWQSVNLDHPATFETLAIDLEAKKAIIEDLEKFVKRKELYRKVGKAWKRGYLLYGPPGTGKSSLVAAMANYLNFDIYDLELSEVRSNSALRKALIRTSNRSILVVEDIDCSIKLPDRHGQPTTRVFNHRGRLIREDRGVTLSGLLNFVDGLWSTCGDERIIVFTTNHIDKLDPALLRPGRMDVHIHMSYCTPEGFRTLASNYLGITCHPLFTEVEALILKTRVTPAEVGEQLMRHEDPDPALKGLIEFIEEKQANEDSKAREGGCTAQEARVQGVLEKNESSGQKQFEIF
ncbi:hypothetical protein CDL15_Pgr004296 [Punica granatum]|uniref:AAA+ ATPase domain-containing protein n=1 Tax=Punica granatum TaxID=22663 RepID=A0A218XF71_PUNGR|nr:hypothetical protein CDL15_Pgr004296 [Punica granatum]